jgi:dGTPase
MGLKSQRIAYLRALAINTLINEAVRIYIENEDKILDGSFEKSLMSTSNFKAQMDDIIDISVQKVYKSKEVIEKELTGYKVLNFLLKTFTSSVINWRDDKVNAFDELALECIPKEYLNKDTDLYSSLLDVSCFIASLTDGLALEWYKKLS